MTSTKANHSLTSGTKLGDDEKKKSNDELRLRPKDPMITYIRARFAARIKYTYEKGASEDPSLYNFADMDKIFEHLISKRPPHAPNGRDRAIDFSLYKY